MDDDSKQVNGQSEKLDAIRDIIFGEELKLFQNHLNQLKKKLDALSKRVDAVNENVEKIEKSISDDRDSSVKVNKETQATIDRLKKELDDQLKTITDTKVSKSEIGQVFIEWGMKVKQETK
ncbi:MAG: hypothetical protein V2J62_06785 [candidate division KSB1 bacterium]|jgi:predicted  nucleic acid-binding Zn-ribbon protein|nr:hypothetical protein [candidate division KSB1 bacterium]